MQHSSPCMSLFACLMISFFCCVEILCLLTRVKQLFLSDDGISRFGDGQMFVVALNVKFLTDTELLLTHSPHADRLMWRPLVDFFFDPSQIGCEILDTLTVISEKLSLLTLMSQTQLSSCLIRYLDAFYHVPFSLLVDNASHPQLVSKYRARSSIM